MDAVKIGNLFQRHVKVVGVAAEGGEFGVGQDAAGVPGQHAEGDFVIGQGGKRGDFIARERRKFFREIQAAIRGEAAQEGFAQGDGRGLSVGTGEEEGHESQSGFQVAVRRTFPPGSSRGGP